MVLVSNGLSFTGWLVFSDVMRYAGAEQVCANCVRPALHAVVWVSVSD